jgi:pimeloyl-ACP methyl ester carboxylesterase
MRKKSMLLIHGINSNGEWYATFTPLLGDFFSVHEVRYPQYVKLGPLKLALYLGGLLLAAGLAFCAGHTGVALETRLTTGMLAVVALVGAAFEFIRRERAYSCVVEKSRPVLERSIEDPPHVLAHSFGTVMLGRALRRTTAHFQNLILVGSALRRDFDWIGLKIGTARVGAILNEVGLTDFVAWLAAWGRYLVGTELGGAGRWGFVIKHESQKAWLDNRISRFGHSDALRLRMHAIVVWLPHLWGVSISQYSRLLRAANEAFQPDADLDPRVKTERLKAVLSSHVTPDCTVEDYFRHRCDDENTGSATYEQKILEFADLVALYLVCALQDDAPERDRWCLDPSHAVREAADAILGG